MSNDCKKNGTGPNSGGVLPFQAPGGESKRPGTRPPKRRTLRPVGGDFRDGTGPPIAAEGEEAADLGGQVARLAARGLDEAEIRARLELPERLDGASEDALAVAFRRGQLLGRAAIKEAQFEAALAGRVTAQTQVLARLGESPGEERGESEEPGLGRDFPSGDTL